MIVRVNLLETLDLDSSGAYVRRVVARVLGHALADGMGWDEVRTFWEQCQDPARYPEYVPSIRAAAAS